MDIHKITAGKVFTHTSKKGKIFGGVVQKLVPALMDKFNVQAVGGMSFPLEGCKFDDETQAQVDLYFEALAELQRNKSEAIKNEYLAKSEYLQKFQKDLPDGFWLLYPGFRLIDHICKVICTAKNIPFEIREYEKAWSIIGPKIEWREKKGGIIEYTVNGQTVTIPAEIAAIFPCLKNEWNYTFDRGPESILKVVYFFASN